MNPGNADVVEMLHFIAHKFGGHDGLFGHRDVAGSSRNYSDHSLAIDVRIALQHDCPRQLTVRGGANFLLYRCELLFVGMCGENIASLPGQAREDFCRLRWSLSFSEDHLDRK